ncbi:MAG: phosphate propanoyltransferase [Firmicutes bacterium]|nr:phosphate propanoyltransferase [Bacillota bacterium]
MKIICELSVRHAHLAQEHVDILFSKGHKLTPVKDLSQPGQYLCAERVEIVTPKMTMKNVGIIGPVRAKSQVEISRTDTFALGLKGVPVRQSGELDGSVGVILRTDLGEVALNEGVIVAQRHIHMDPKSASEFGLADNQMVSVKFLGDRGGVLYNTVVRVSESFAPAVHIDSDEANALGHICGHDVEIIK